MSKIEWCDITINPYVGCSKCSPGCANCYAEKFARRLAKNTRLCNQYGYNRYKEVLDIYGRWNGEIIYESNWESKIPKKPRRIFLGSMTDMFHECVSEWMLHKIFKLIREDGNIHTFMLLTKRPQNIKRFIEYSPLPDNVWLGVTVCNQKEVEEKIPLLLQIPASKHFVSIEPMLEEISLWGWFSPQLNWVICGAETGSGARPMNLEWARILRDQCAEAGVPFFFKKAGNKTQIPDDLMIRQFPK